MLLYPALVHKDPGSDYGASFPDFPGCVTAAATMEELHTMAAGALALHIQGMQHDGQPIPAPAPALQLDDADAIAVIWVPAGVER